ncbi:S1 RNA-binding domain-containing protein [Heliobacterium undosum]|uniref:S1 RNA-binding domain-containing protein n=1 Tax=Heliomicrobium undosum TaxID=121734 RepID=A0A845LBY8_9FIRM|nr:S1 RNA-binding domain-containing protein [Heliomicrobium undosum]MZP31188.1 S1 RNA-binding domain-containing protein [Heliomicrobium undosum]
MTTSNLITMFRPEGFSYEHSRPAESAWVEIYRAKQNDMIVQALAGGIEKHRMPVRKDGKIEETEQPCLIALPGDDIKVIIPMHLSGMTRERDLQQLVGAKVAFSVIAVDRESGLVVGSRLGALEKMAERTWKELKVGAIRDAVVRKVNRVQAYLDLGGVYVWLKPQDAGHTYIPDMRDSFKVGDVVRVHVTELDREKQSVKVSLKPLVEDPWNHVTRRYLVKGKYHARVTKTMETGFLVTLACGVTAFVPHPRHRRLMIGDELVVQIRKIDPQERRIWAVVPNPNRGGQRK